MGINICGQNTNEYTTIKMFVNQAKFKKTKQSKERNIAKYEVNILARKTRLSRREKKTHKIMSVSDSGEESLNVSSSEDSQI